MGFITDNLSVNKELLSSIYHVDVSGNLNIDGSFYQNGAELYETKTNLDSSFGLYTTSADIALKITTADLQLINSPIEFAVLYMNDEYGNIGWNSNLKYDGSLNIDNGNLIVSGNVNIGDGVGVGYTISNTIPAALSAFSPFTGDASEVLNLQHGSTAGTNTVDLIQGTYGATPGSGTLSGRITMNTSTKVLGIAADSDASIKNSIKNWDIDALSILNNIPVRQFYFNDDVKKKNLVHGWVAQEVQPYVPEMIIDNHEILALNINGLDHYYHKAIQQLSKENQELKERLESIEKRLEILEE